MTGATMEGPTTKGAVVEEGVTAGKVKAGGGTQIRDGWGRDPEWIDKEGDKRRGERRVDEKERLILDSFGTHSKLGHFKLHKS